MAFFSCNERSSYPRPLAYFAHTFEPPSFTTYENEFVRLPLNKQVQIKNTTERSIELYYPALKASVFINYTPVNMPLEKLEEGIDQKLGEHQKKATTIVAFPYDNAMDRKSGVLYEIKGNAASAAQFYITDGTDHFLSGALYFNVKPNYDSIYPSAQYVIQDMREIINKLAWKNNP